MAERSTPGQPELSIVITTRNRYAHLVKCLESLALATQGTAYEVIVIDDCSTDETKGLDAAGVQREYGLRDVTVVHSETALRMVRARNRGAGLARGRLVLFVDDDNVVDRGMIRQLVSCADSAPDLGIVGPSMYMLKDREKYLDYQTINLYTMHTRLHVDGADRELNESDGIPNVFMVKKEVFERAGYFDPDLIQSFTEPDYSFNASRYGFRTAMCPGAVTYHDIDLAERGRHMGSIPAKSYCLIRNRFIINRRYGSPFQRVVFLLLFSWIWPLAYSLSAVRNRNLDRVRYYFAGFVDGLYYSLTGAFRERKSITGPS